MNFSLRDKIELYLVYQVKRSFNDPEEVTGFESVHLTANSASRRARELEEKEKEENIRYYIREIELLN